MYRGRLKASSRHLRDAHATLTRPPTAAVTRDEDQADLHCCTPMRLETTTHAVEACTPIHNSAAAAEEVVAAHPCSVLMAAAEGEAALAVAPGTRSQDRSNTTASRQRLRIAPAPSDRPDWLSGFTPFGAHRKITKGHGCKKGRAAAVVRPARAPRRANARVSCVSFYLRNTTRLLEPGLGAQVPPQQLKAL